MLGHAPAELLGQLLLTCARGYVGALPQCYVEKVPFIPPIASTELAPPNFTEYVESTSSSKVLATRGGLICEVCVTTGYWF